MAKLINKGVEINDPLVINKEVNTFYSHFYKVKGLEDCGLEHLITAKTIRR